MTNGEDGIMENWIGIDIGGTDMKFAVFNREAEIVRHGSVPTPQGDAGVRIPEAVEAVLASLLGRYPNSSGVGISTAGVVHPDSGEIVFSGPTLPGYRGTNLKRVVEDRFGLPANVLNDVNAAAQGERWKGAARGVDHFFCVTIGTGIGGALFSEGKLVLGPHFRAGEIGHSLYEKGSGTTYEQRASMSALLRRAADELPGFSGSGRELFARAGEGDAACRRLLDGWTEEIARGLAEIVLLADPEVIVVGGGVSEQKELLLEPIRGHLSAYLPEGFCRTSLKPAELGNRAALYGVIYPYFIREMERSNDGAQLG
ncbi:ROK family protein [Cohnella sp. AR92]|nr:ROK family protein [Cohnella sp. AR92]